VYVRANEYDREDGLHWYSQAHESAKVFSSKYRHAKGLAIRSNSAKGATAEIDAIVTNAEYPYYAMHYVKLADRLGLIPNQLQAICWVTWRRLKGNIEQNDLPF